MEGGSKLIDAERLDGIQVKTLLTSMALVSSSVEEMPVWLARLFIMITLLKPCPQSIVDDTGKEKLDKRVVIAGRRENGLMTLLPG